VQDYYGHRSHLERGIASLQNIKNLEGLVSLDC